MEGKRKEASDETYKELKNLLPRLLKHQALEAEVKSNKTALADVNEKGQDIVKRNGGLVVFWGLISAWLGECFGWLVRWIVNGELVTG